MTLAVIVIGAVSTAAAGVLALDERWTGTSDVDWNVVTGVSAVGSAVASAATLAILVLSLPDLEANARDSRIARGPYVRVDVAFAEPLGRQPGLELPTGRPYPLAEILADPPPVPHPAMILPETGEQAFTLVLWATNLQVEPLGIADDVNVSIEITAARDGRDYETTSFVVRLAYLAPRQSTGVELLRVKRDAELFTVRVSEVRYQDTFGKQMADTHGALTMHYDRGTVINQREVIRGKGRSTS